MNRYLTIVLMLGSFLLSSCDKSNMEYENAYEKSLRNWKEFKAANLNSYEYEVSGGSVFGYRWQTINTIVDGSVTRRTFRYTLFNDTAMPENGWTMEKAQEIIDHMSAHGWGGSADPEMDAEKLLATLSWTETAAAGGNLAAEAEQRQTAWPAETLDQVYQRLPFWLKKRPAATIIFETGDNGLISRCGYYEDGCMDDCFNGIIISRISPLNFPD